MLDLELLEPCNELPACPIPPRTQDHGQGADLLDKPDKVLKRPALALPERRGHHANIRFARPCFVASGFKSKRDEMSEVGPLLSAATRGKRKAPRERNRL